MADVHPDLVAVIRKAATLTKTAFSVSRGRIAQGEVDALVAAGLGLPRQYTRNVSGHAVNLVPVDPETGDPQPYGPCFSNLADAVCLAAHELCIPVDWRGWYERDRDESQFELRKDTYATDWATSPFRA